MGLYDWLFKYNRTIARQALANVRLYHNDKVKILWANRKDRRLKLQSLGLSNIEIGSIMKHTGYLLPFYHWDGDEGKLNDYIGTREDENYGNVSSSGISSR